MQGIIPSNASSTPSVPGIDMGFMSALSDAKGLLIGLTILSILLKIGGLFSTCLACLIVQYLFKIVAVFVILSWNLHATMMATGVIPSIWLCNLYSVMPSIIFTIAVIGAWSVADLVPMPAFIMDIITLIFASIILTIVSRYSSQQLHLRMIGATYNNSLWNFYI